MKPLLTILLPLLANATLLAQSSISGTIIDAQTLQPLPFATLAIIRSNNIINATATNTNGHFSLPALPSDSLAASYIGYEPQLLPCPHDHIITITLHKSTLSLAEVRVTASEVESARTSTSIISQTAMAHLQPTSLTDIMSLLPGGLTSAPQMGSANTISLREVPYADNNYATSALGTKITIDGAPLGADADLNKITDNTDDRNIAGRGIDLRSIATDNIESIEVIRGIPSVRYGEVTSGIVNIHRRTGGSPLTIRLKADTKSRLASIAKGLNLPSGWSLSLDASLLYSKIDPRNRYETFRRINLSARARKSWTPADNISLTWSPALDYTRNIDNEKQDPEVQISKNDKFQSSYNRTSLANTLSISLPNSQLLLRQSLSLSHDLILKDALVNVTSQTYAAIDSTDGLPHDATPLTSNYIAHHEVDGRPLYSNIQLSLNRNFPLPHFSHNASLGIEWQLNKNFGHGQIFDPQHPLSGSTSRRPRSFRAIPPTNILALWLEDNISLPLRRATAHLSLGLRLNQMAALAHQFSMHGRLYADPRLSLAFDLPNFRSAHVNISLGWGRLCKMPTIEMLNPDKLYVDIYEMNYWNANPDIRRAIVRTYAINRDAPNLQPAHNTKLEARLSFRLNGHSLSFTAFRENMDDAFRSMSTPISLPYNEYDLSSFNPASTSKPNPNILPSTPKKRLTIISKWQNGSRINKNGLEWTLETPRLPIIATRLNISGAYFKTIRENSLPEWRRETLKTVLGIVIDNHYAGLYDWKNTYSSQRTSTTFTAESFFDNIGFIFSATAECVWNTRTTYPLLNAQPTHYVSDDAIIKPYTNANANDPILRTLAISNTTSSITTSSRPYATFNFKATKRFGSNITLSFFADRLLAAARDYEVNGFIMRRSFSAYFGAQAIAKF